MSDMCFIPLVKIFLFLSNSPDVLHEVVVSFFRAFSPTNLGCYVDR